MAKRSLAIIIGFAALTGILACCFLLLLIATNPPAGSHKLAVMESASDAIIAEYPAGLNCAAFWTHEYNSYILFSTLMAKDGTTTSFGCLGHVVVPPRDDWLERSDQYEP